MQRERAAGHIVSLSITCPWALDVSRPKRVMFLVATRNLYDEDNLRSITKYLRDSLIGLAIDGDSPRHPHVFEYAQILDRRRPGVRIRIEPLEGAR